MGSSKEWPPEAKKPDAKGRDRSAERRRRSEGPQQESDPSVDALVSKLGDTMNMEVRDAERKDRVERAMGSHARTQRHAERLYALTNERHEREAAEHAKKLEAAKSRLKQGAADRKMRTERLSELRQQLTKLNRIGAHKDVDAEVERLEQEIYAIERQQEVRAQNEPAVAEGASYEGDSHYQAPTILESKLEKASHGAEDTVIELPDESGVVQSYEGDPHYAVPAVFTPLEGRRALREVVEQFSDAPKESAAPAERTNLKEKEAAYLNAYRAVEKEKTFFKRLFKSQELKEREAELDSLRHEYDQARVAYAEAIQGSVNTTEVSDSFRYRKTKEYNFRLEEGSLPEGTTFEKFLESEMQRRQDAVGRYLAFREVVRPVAERKLAARQEALDSRGRNIFEKALGWSAKHNQELEEKYGKTGARAVRAAMGALVFSVGAAGLGAAGVIAPMGIAALAGYGGFKFVRSLTGALAGAAAGEAAAHGFEAVWGRRSLEAARKKQRTEGRHAHITLESLRKTDRSRERLATEASEMTLIKRKQLIRALTALGVGAGAAATLAEFAPVHEAADAAADADTQKPAGPEGMIREAAIGKGEGFNHLFEDIRSSGFNGSTPVGNLLLNKDFSLTELSDQVGGFDPETGKSMLMLEGDRLVVDENENVWFVREGESPKLVLENDPAAPGGVKIHELSEYRMLGTNSIPETPSIKDVAAETETVSAPNEPSVTPVDVVEESPAPATAASPTIETPPEPPPVAETTPSVTNTAEVPESVPRPETEGPNVFGDPYVNGNGVSIDPSEPHIYENSNGRLFMSGGSKEAVYEQAQEYADAKQVPVFVDASYVDALGNTVRRAIGFAPDGQGGIGIMPSSDPEVQVRPEEYIRRVQ